MAAPLPWLVVTTVGSREQAQQLARTIVHLQLAACAQIEAAIRQHHPYELPAIHALATCAADPAYAAWVTENSAGKGDHVPTGDLL